MRKDPPSPQPDAPDTALGALLKARGFAAAEEPTPVVHAPRGERPIDLAKMGKLVVQRERKGHGGKTVTVLSGLALPGAELERIARALRKALGVGTSVEGLVLLIQGDQRDRAKSWLQAHGAKSIVVGGV